MNLSKYDDIRPFESWELPAVFERLLANEQFQQVLQWLYKDVPLEMIRQKMLMQKSCLDFQKAFCYDFLKNLMQKASKGMDFCHKNVDLRQRHTFITNHRDIVLDSALLDVLLMDSGSETTCEIAIGDNLLSLPWVKDLVRVNKSFIVKRGLKPREMFLASQLLSEYMHLVIEQKKDNIWIAQREGRAKNSDDRTQPAILKMMAMSGQGDVVERLLSLRLCPVAISYELDPCDFLKAKEMQQKRDIEGWHKGPMDDVVSMQTGIMGHKGRVHYEAAKCLNDWLLTLDRGMKSNELFALIAKKIDREIHLHYRLYPVNFVAWDLLDGSTAHEDRYTADDKRMFENYLAGQLQKIDLPDKDETFLRERMLEMYANPARNQFNAKGE